MKRFLALALLSVTLGCHGYIVHPGAINTFDSQAYDALLGAKATIDTARTQIASGALPATVKPPFNELVKAYNLADAAYLTWHDAANKGLPADALLTALNKDIANLTKAIAAFRSTR